MSLLILFDTSGGAEEQTLTEGWGANWGFGVWGLTAAQAAATGGSNPPTILSRTPFPNDTNVAENASVTIVFFDVDGDIELPSVSVTIDGGTVYSAGSFAAGYIGSVEVNVGQVVVRFTKIGGWGFDTTVSLSASVADVNANSYSDIWSWTTRSNPVCYSGLTPLPIELALLNPLTTYLNLDVVRRTLLDNALRTRDVTNSDLRAARVVYQQAFDTEISSILNPYGARDEVAIATTVCERQSTINVDRALTRVTARVLDGIETFRLGGELPVEYASAFRSYVDSVQYSYRVSLAANLVLLAVAIENNV